jgi:hypothetical protein
VGSWDGKAAENKSRRLFIAFDKNSGVGSKGF